MRFLAKQKTAILGSLRRGTLGIEKKLTPVGSGKDRRREGGGKLRNSMHFVFTNDIDNLRSPFNGREFHLAQMILQG